jgi:hypothetical protein
MYARHGQALAEHCGLLEPLGDPLDVLLPLERLAADMAGERVVRVDLHELSPHPAGVPHLAKWRA